MTAATFLVWLYPSTWLAAYDEWIPMRMREPLLGTRGASLTEYAIVVGLIAIVAITAVTGVGNEVEDIFEKIETELQKLEQ